MSTLLEIISLNVSFPKNHGVIKVLTDVSFNVQDNQHVAIIGESGSGKTVLIQSLIRILNDNAIIEGKILFNNNDILKKSPVELCQIRKRSIVYIPQNAVSSFNPMIRIGPQIGEIIEDVVPNRRAREEAVLGAFERVGFKDSNSIYYSYPYQLSGGMCQRAILSMSLLVNPALLIIDEPTKGLDYPSRNSVMKTISQTVENRACIVVTHDLSIAKQFSRLVVMYAGEIVESGDTDVVLNTPSHPYTSALFRSHPTRGLVPIDGYYDPSVMSSTSCRFAGRCNVSTDLCHLEKPPLQKRQYKEVRCFYA